MSLRTVLIVVILAWVALVTILHAWLNLKPSRADTFRVGYLPVT